MNMLALLVGVLALTGPQSTVHRPQARILAQEEEVQEPETLQEPVPEDLVLRGRRLLEEDGSPWVDFDWLEMQPRLGLAIFTEDYHIGPSPVLSLLARAPVPLLSPGSDPDGEYFGIFAEVSFLPTITRDVEPEPPKASGSALFWSVGMDFTFLRNQSLYVSAQAGVQYAWYGGITNLTNGFGSTVGVTAGAFIGGGLTLLVAPEVAFGNSGDKIYLASLGLLVEF